MTHKVFVYGTLKAGSVVRGMDKFPTAKLQGEAMTTEPEFDMISLGAFPAAKLSGNNRILGEVWSVDDAVFEALDWIEGYPDFYSRTEVTTTLGTAWMYYLPDVERYNHEKIKPIMEGVVEWI